MRKTFAVILMIGLFVCASTAAEKWTRVEMTNFTLVGPASEKELKTVGHKLEQFRQALSLFMPKAKLESSVPTIVYVFDSYDEFQSYFEYGKKDRKLAGIFISTAEGNYINVSIEKRNYDVFDIIFHEYFHHILRQNMVRAPRWLHEGMAEYFSTFAVHESGLKAKIGMPLPRRITELRKRDFMPLDKLFAVNSRSPEYNETDKAGLFYAQSWALVHFMLNGNNGARRGQFYAFLDSVISGTSPKDAFQKSFGVGYEKIEAELKKYLNKFTFPVYEIDLPKQSSLEETGKISVLGESEMKTLQGNLLRFTASSERAEKKLLEALDADPNNTQSYRLLGAIYDFQKKSSDARRSYEKALALEPDNYLNYYNLIKFLREDKNHAEAIRYARQAIRLNSGSARSFTALGTSYESIFEDEEALLAYSQSLKLQPAYGINYFNVAKLAFRTNRNELAYEAAVSTIAVDSWINNNSVKAALIAYFSSRRENKPERAEEILRLGMEKIDKNNYYHAVFRYLKGEIDENKLLSLGKDANDQTIASAYLGLNLLLQNKKSEAKAKFKWIKEGGNQNFTEYGYAVKEFSRLDAVP